MYRMTCDGLPLLDARDDSLKLTSPKIKLEVNTVGEGSFKIYQNHPHYNALKILKSVFEVSDEHGAVFRGRMTEHTKDIHNGKAVDLEGAMSYFNDSVVRPYTFPDDFLEDAEYKAAVAKTPEQEDFNGGVVGFLLKWYIDRHNEQVEPFQQFKLGNVTVYDKNNFIERASSDYPSTWQELSSKLFDSSLGGYLCIRYEDDGNYIDYLAEFTEINKQGIQYGKNLRDLSQKEDGNETYSAIIPLGKDGLTINGEELPGGEIVSDICIKGDTLYSKSAVDAYGWRYAPRANTKWDDVTKPGNLLTKGIECLIGNITSIPNTIEAKAVDLHCTDAEIRALRIYKKIPVYVESHGINENFDLTSLDIDLLNPQNTNIFVGKKATTLTALQAKQQNELKDRQKTIEMVANLSQKLDSNVKITSATTDENGVIEFKFDIAGEPISKKFGEHAMCVQLSEDGTLIKGNVGMLFEDANNKKDAIDLTWDKLDAVNNKLTEALGRVDALEGGGSISTGVTIGPKPPLNVMVQLK